MTPAEPASGPPVRVTTPSAHRQMPAFMRIRLPPRLTVPGRTTTEPPAAQALIAFWMSALTGLTVVTGAGGWSVPGCGSGGTGVLDETLKRMLLLSVVPTLLVAVAWMSQA